MPYYTEPNFSLYHQDSVQFMKDTKQKFDMIFADPPYFLSNDGTTVVNGKFASVNKGEWDREDSVSSVDSFNLAWLEAAKTCMKEGATIWVTGTMHNIFSVGSAMHLLGYKILNIITWEKPNPPPNLSCRYFTHSTEFVIWAKKDKDAKHVFHYETMKQINGNKQMKDVWKLSASAKWEKSFGKHPTQKPLSLLTRIILASTSDGDTVFDPFCGSGTTGVAANLYDRGFVGVDLEKAYLDICVSRKADIEDVLDREFYRRKIEKGFSLSINS